MSDADIDDPYARPSEWIEHAPGDAPEETSGHWVRSYLIGLGFAALLTAASFWLAISHVIWFPALPAALIVLAIAQMGVHLVFFLHDELVVHTPEALAPAVEAALREAAVEAGRMLFGSAPVEFALTVATVESYADAK